MNQLCQKKTVLMSLISFGSFLYQDRKEQTRATYHPSTLWKTSVATPRLGSFKTSLLSDQPRQVAQTLLQQLIQLIFLKTLNGFDAFDLVEPVDHFFEVGAIIHISRDDAVENTILTVDGDGADVDFLPVIRIFAPSLSILLRFMGLMPKLTEATGTSLTPDFESLIPINWYVLAMGMRHYQRR